MATDPAGAKRALERFADDLADTTDADTAAARQLLDAARRSAAGHPTRQARMAASGLVLEAAAIVGHPRTTVHGTGGAATLGGGFLLGAVFGGNPSHGLSPRRRSGYWLIPNINDPEQWIEPIRDHVDDAVNRLDRAG